MTIETILLVTTAIGTVIYGISYMIAINYVIKNVDRNDYKYKNIDGVINYVHPIIKISAYTGLLLAIISIIAWAFLNYL